MDVEKIGQSQWFATMWDSVWSGFGWAVGAGFAYMLWEAIKKDSDGETEYEEIE